MRVLSYQSVQGTASGGLYTTHSMWRDTKTSGDMECVTKVLISMSAQQAASVYIHTQTHLTTYLVFDHAVLHQQRQEQPRHVLYK